ncbi:non-specific lipid-transfer protein 7-like [Vigna radiata var. radiata]|uniref:Non-specific lipid-transfer protein 7-like n=1 Tax=Vigna radiata var. radiata TaxID=3916 RepID=A0A1S3UA50_VIGRR|nr:non-specific lipid-transfer protein 7-like [Vigna radiata var. radiata]
MGKREFALMVMFAGILVLGNLQEASQFYREDGPTEPSPECCEELKRQNIDQQCACDYIASRPPGIGPRNGIDLNRTVSVSRDCGIYVPAGLRCGDFIIPPSPAPYPAPPPEEGN